MRALCTTNKNKSANKMSSSDEEEDEEEEREESEEEEEEEEEDSDSEYHHSQDDDENFIREQNVKALRDGLPLSKIRYASVLSNLKPPEPDEVILKRHFAPLVPGGALQTGTFLVCLLRFVSRVRERSRFWIFERFFFVRRPKRRVFWVPTFEKKSTSSLSLSVSSLFVVIAFTLHFSSDDSISKTFSFSVTQLGYKERFSLGKYSSRSDRSSKSSCRELSRPTRTRKISCSQKASKSWCCGKTRIRKEKRRRVRYLR